MPPEEFRISREAKTVQTAALIGHERMVPLSQLIQLGYPPAVILGDDYGTSAAISTVEQDMRNPGGLGQLMMGARAASEGDPLIQYGEWFIRIDKDGDGVPELRKICTIGDGDRIIMDEPVSRAKFALFCPDPEPHTAIGHGVGRAGRRSAAHQDQHPAQHARRDRLDDHAAARRRRHHGQHGRRSEQRAWLDHPGEAD